MKIIWCKDLKDLINIARNLGWLFYYNYRSKHYYYLYAGPRAEDNLCVAIEVQAPIKEKYVSIDEDGKLVTSDKPIMPACARITEVAKDELFEGLVK
jgi:hypothetical protein